MQKSCEVHSERQADWRCEKCKQCFCQSCIDEAADVFDPIATRCPSCRGRCHRTSDSNSEPVAAQHRVHVPAIVEGGASLHLAEQTHADLKDKSWLDILKGSFAYPVRNDNWWALVVAVAFFILADWLLSFAPLLGLFFTVFFAGYFCSYWISIVLHTMNGDMDLPLWPDFNEDGIMGPLFRFVVPTLFAIGPSIIASFWFRAPVVGTFLLYGGLVILPMMLLSAIVLNNTLAANPLVAIPAALNVPGPYLSVVGMFVLCSILLQISIWIGSNTGFLGGVLIRYANLYLSVLAMHVLGLFYFRYSNEIGWFPDKD